MVGEESVVEVAAQKPGIGPLDLAGAARLPPGEVLKVLDVTESGLSESQAEERARTFGPNVLLTHRVTAAGVLIRQIRNPLLILLVAAAAVSGVTGDPVDAGIITAIVALSVGLGFVNEYRSELAVPAARKYPPRGARMRDGFDGGSTSASWCRVTSCRCISAI